VIASVYALNLWIFVFTFAVLNWWLLHKRETKVKFCFHNCIYRQTSERELWKPVLVQYVKISAGVPAADTGNDTVLS